MLLTQADALGLRIHQQHDDRTAFGASRNEDTIGKVPRTLHY